MQYEMKCPKCGDSDSIRVVAEVWIDILLDQNNGELIGHDGDNSNHEWDKTSRAYCSACGFEGEAGDFYNDKFDKPEPKAEPSEHDKITRTAPRWAWDLVDETLGLDANSKAFDADLRAKIGKALDQIMGNTA